MNGIASHSGIKEGAVGKNRIAGHSRIEPEMKRVNNYFLNVKFSIEE